MPWLIAALAVTCLAFLFFFWLQRRRSTDVGPQPLRLGEVTLKLVGGGEPEGVEARAFASLADGKFSSAERCESLPNARVRCRLRPGRYWIIGRASGQARFTVRADVPQGGSSEIQVQLEAAQKLNVDVRSREENEELRPLPEATVLIRASAGDRTNTDQKRFALELPFGALTDREGRAQFSDLGRGPYHVQVFARGYEPYEAEIQSDPLIVLKPVRALLVRVEDDGKKAPHAVIHVAGISLWPPREVRTNEQGKAQIYGLSSGRYAVTAELGEKVSRAPVFVELAQGRGVEEITLALGAGQKIVVRVRDKTQGTALSGAHVSYAPSLTFERVRAQTTDHEGATVFAPLAQVNGTLQVAAPGYVGRTVAARDVSQIDVELEAGGTVTGVVRNERGEPVSGANVKILGHDELGQPIVHEPRGTCTEDAYFAWMGQAQSRVVPAGELGVMLGPVPPIPLYMRASGPCPTAPSSEADMLVTGSDGKFSAHGIAPGTVLALAEHPDYQNAKSNPGRLSSAGHLALEVTLRSGEPLRGRVLDHRDFPVIAALVRVTGREFERDVRTEQDGTFRLAAAPESVTVRALGTLGGGGAGLEAHVAGEQRKSEVILRLPAPRESVRVRVVDADSRPLDFAEVRVRSLGDEPYRETRFTSAVGEAEFQGARGLLTQVRIEAPGQVVLEVERRLSEVETFQLARASTVSGRITAVRGRWPAPNAEVRLSCGEQSYQTHTNDAGEYEIRGVPQGACRIRAHHPEHGQGTLGVRVEATDRSRSFALPDLDLSPPVQVHGVVRDDTGQVVPFAIVSTLLMPVYLPLDTRHYPEPWVEADEHGQFAFAAHFEGEPRLFAVSPAVGRGEAQFGLGNVEEQNVEIRITKLDEAPPEAVGGVLVGVHEAQGRVNVESLLVDNPATRKLRIGDEIVSIDREPVTSAREARAWLSGAPGSEVELVIQRGARTLTVLVERESFRRGK